MIRFIPILLIFLLGACKGVEESTSEEIINIKAEEISIIPKPTSIKWGQGTLTTPAANVLCFNPEAGEAAEWLSHLLNKTNLDLYTTPGNSCGNWNLVADATLRNELGAEGYILEINDGGVSLRAATSAGLFYAVQTLRQILPSSLEDTPLESKRLQLPHLYIKDIPQYAWRGTMVDVARSFFGLEYLKSHVDRMALYKMNRLHLHLTDDQGWRIEIKSKPGLTNVGSKGAVENGRSGYLTQKEYLNCEEFSNIEPRMATPPELFTGTKVGWSKLCLTNSGIYDFVSTVIGEMASITNGPWIHIGGDEIKDDLYEAFVVKADSIVQHHGKTTIGWEEGTKAKVSNSLISQQWHGKVKSLVDVKVLELLGTSFNLIMQIFPGRRKPIIGVKKLALPWKKYIISAASIKMSLALKLRCGQNLFGMTIPLTTDSGPAL